MTRAPATHPADRTFDRRPQFDERSRSYPIRAALPEQVERKAHQWRPGLVIDQGREGACVGFGWTGELLASPVRVKVPDDTAGDTLALDIYHQARTLDEWPGEDYEGTSVLAGAKALTERGYMPEYRWLGVGSPTSAIDDLIDTVIAHGCVVVGTNWHDSMYETRPSGLVEVSGPVVGGHCWLVYGYHPSMRITGEPWTARFEVLRFRNSWGPSYGNGGSALIKVEDMAGLLTDGGEGCVPVRRAYGPTAA